MTQYLHIFVLVAVASCLFFAAISDYKRLLIPNLATGIILLLYPLHVLLSPVVVDWTGALLVMAVVFAIGFGFFIFGLFGAGDVKLMVVLSLWAGIAHVGLFFAVTGLTGGLRAVIYLMKRRMRRYAIAGGPETASQALALAIPYGIAIAFGGLAVLGRLASLSFAG